MSKNKRKHSPTSDQTSSKEAKNERGFIPVTPRMLVEALENLKDSKLKGLNFTPEEVAEYIRENYPCVQPDFPILLLEVKDKLSCAASADIIGYKPKAGYFPFNLKQYGARLDSRSELTFWVLYKRTLDQRKLNEKTKKRTETSSNPLVKKKKTISKSKRNKP